MRLLICAAILLLYITPSLAESVLPDGDEIALKINARDEGLALTRELRMEMTDRKGKKRVRETKAFRKYYDEEKRTAIFYLTPKNVKDTAFLTYDYNDVAKDDDQWLYLPAMRKVRRVSAADRGDYFLGTDFTYEDIKLETRISIADYTRKTLEETALDGVSCLLLESTTINEDVAKELGHSRREDCVDNEIWFIRKTKQWDPKGKLLKTVHFKDIRQVQGIWTAHTVEVENHKTQHKTVFTFSNVEYSDNLDDKIFSQGALRRGI